MPNVKIVAEVIKQVMYIGALRGTKYLSEKDIIRVVRRSYYFGGKTKRFGRHDSNVQLIVTFGKPNYVERDFIRKCKKAGEPFPVKKIQFKFQKKK